MMRPKINSFHEFITAALSLWKPGKTGLDHTEIHMLRTIAIFMPNTK